MPGKSLGHARPKRRVRIGLAQQGLPVVHRLGRRGLWLGGKALRIAGVERLHPHRAGTQSVQGMQCHWQVARQLILVLGLQTQLGV